MHAWLRNTVMRLRFIKSRSQVARRRRLVGGEEGEKKQGSGAGPVERNDKTVPSFSLRRFFRQDNSSFSFLAQRESSLDSQRCVSRRTVVERGARFAMHSGPASAT